MWTEETRNLTLESISKKSLRTRTCIKDIEILNPSNNMEQAKQVSRESKINDDVRKLKISNPMD